MAARRELSFVLTRVLGPKTWRARGAGAVIETLLNEDADDTLKIDTREAEPGGLGLWRLSFRSSLATRPAALEPG